MEKMMFQKDVRTLSKCVKAFQKFQKRYYPHITEEHDNGEWEIGIDQWDRMCSAYLKIIENYDAEYAGEALIHDMLYVIARDSECSHLLVETLKYPEWFEVLCRHSVKSDYYNTRWQFAEQLGSYQGTSDIKYLLFQFIESGEEYTERMALQSLCEHFPERVEEYAVKFWERNIYEEDEYQKIMALYALHKIQSPLLNEYIRKSHATDYDYLKGWAEEYAKGTE
ncbi:MAG: hypothetical protein NC089_03505 [Bacteroides sp.]|nr:hypothetical protein [Bacteroides sp.]MCM1549766.1 hypothetical protein [Clostridium sp.]